MILILSQDSGEATTERVIDWIQAMGGHCARLNGEDLNAGEGFAFHFGTGGCGLRFRLGEREVSHEDIRVIWFRRWHRGENLGVAATISDPGLAPRVSRHLLHELRATFGAMCTLLEDHHWLTRPGEALLNKMRALRAAAGAGLSVPETLITNEKRRLQEFKDRQGRIVTKAVGDASAFPAGPDRTYLMYTAEVSQGDIDRAPDHFFPSLFQELLEKRFEVRVFYLDGDCYPMAIFSQSGRSTRLDFRNYDRRKPNRCVPYRLPEEVEQSIRRFTSTIGLVTGSFDLVHTVDGRYVFLEVNPVGQFSMVSYPCNYRLEKRVAEYLMEHDEHGRA